MTMSCVDWELKLNAQLDGELAAAERAPLEAHLASCADCRRTREALQAQGRDLAALRLDSSALEKRIAAAVRVEPLPRRSRRPILLAASAAAAAIVVAVLLRRPPPPPAPPAPPAPRVLVKVPKVKIKLDYVTGRMEELVNGAWRTSMDCDGFRSGSDIRTGAESKCEFSLRDGTRIRLDAATEIRIDQPRAITLRKGELWAKVPDGPAPFRVTTEDGTFELDPGTYDVSYRPSTRHPSKFDPPVLVTSLAVLDGRGRIADQTVTPTLSCVVENKVVETPVWVDPLLRTRWIHDLLKLRERNDPETAERVTALLAMLGRTKQPKLYESEIRALGDRSVPALLALVTKLPENLSAYDRRNAMRLLVDLAGPSEVEALVGLTSDADGEIWTSANVALIRITGQNLKGGDAWKSWYKENQDAWRPKK